MVLSQKSKCTGCLALVIGKGGYTCGLKFKVESTKVGGNNYSPVPSEKCYKPKTEDEHTKSKQLVKDKKPVITQKAKGKK